MCDSWAKTVSPLWVDAAWLKSPLVVAGPWRRGLEVGGSNHAGE